MARNFTIRMTHDAKAPRPQDRCVANVYEGKSLVAQFRAIGYGTALARAREWIAANA